MTRSGRITLIKPGDCFFLRDIRIIRAIRVKSLGSDLSGWDNNRSALFTRAMERPHQHHLCYGISFIVRVAEENLLHSLKVHEVLHPAGDVHDRSAAFAMKHLYVRPLYARAPAGADGLEHGFLGCEPARRSAVREISAGAVFPLAFREHPLKKTRDGPSPPCRCGRSSPGQFRCRRSWFPLKTADKVTWRRDFFVICDFALCAMRYALCRLFKRQLMPSFPAPPAPSRRARPVR